jgi:hypothetical protein
MQRINVQYFYLLASKLLPIRTLQAEAEILTVWSVLYDAERELQSFLNNPFLPPTTSHAAGNDLLKALSTLTTKPFEGDTPNYQVTLNQGDISNLLNLLQCFEIVLQAEFSRRDIFAVSRKGLYSTTDLIEGGEGMVSESVREKMPELIRDLNDAGRCVAFELPTAAAFHLYRAAEAATKAYILFVRGTPVNEAERKRGMGGYANCLKQKDLCVDERIYTSLEQLVRLHRNPSIHPDQHISSAEVIGTIGMVVSVIEVMALDMDRRQNTPEVPLSEFLPDDLIKEEVQTTP